MTAITLIQPEGVSRKAAFKPFVRKPVPSPRRLLVAESVPNLVHTYPDNEHFKRHDELIGYLGIDTTIMMLYDGPNGASDKYYDSLIEWAFPRDSTIPIFPIDDVALCIAPRDATSKRTIPTHYVGIENKIPHFEYDGIGQRGYERAGELGLKRLLLKEYNALKIARFIKET